MKFHMLILFPGLILTPFVFTAAEETLVRVVDTPAVDVKGVATAFNLAPLGPAPIARLPLGSITPQGWLRHQLELQVLGMHGRLAEISPFLKWEGNGWVDPNGAAGWEELPYWLRGYGDLGYVLKDEKIIQETRHWIAAILATQQADGWFGPRGLRTSLEGKPDMWPHMLVLDALRSYYEYSGDEKVLSFMLRYARWQNTLPGESFSAGYWPRMRFGDNLETIHWLYNRTGEAWLLDLARKIHENMADGTSDVPNWHNVNIAQGFREPAVYWVQARQTPFLAAAERNYQKVMGIYGQFPGGGFAGDENCRPGHVDPRQGFETCGIVEFMRSFQILTRISGNPIWADRCEELAFNTLPAALTPDLKALHYLTAANMVQLDRGNKAPGIQNSGTMFSYSPLEVYRCCQHNHGIGWPYYAEELWLATADGGLCASLYAASEVNTKIGGKSATEIRIVEKTSYPFDDTITFSFDVEKPIRFPLYLRMPGWVREARLTLNGTELSTNARPLSYLVIQRTWQKGDQLTLRLPMQPGVRTWAKNKDSVSIDLGPLTFSLKIGERWVRYGGTDEWPEWEVFPTTAWNYGLILEGEDLVGSMKLERRSGPLPPQPFTPENVPLSLRVKARKIPQWKLDRFGLVDLLPQSPVASQEPEETVTLIPMGAARLRISAFPRIATTSAQPAEAQ